MNEQLILPTEVVEEAFKLLGEMPSKISRDVMNKIEQTAKPYSAQEPDESIIKGGE